MQDQGIEAIEELHVKDHVLAAVMMVLHDHHHGKKVVVTSLVVAVRFVTVDKPGKMSRGKEKLLIWAHLPFC